MSTSNRSRRNTHYEIVCNNLTKFGVVKRFSCARVMTATERSGLIMLFRGKLSGRSVHFIQKSANMGGCSCRKGKGKGRRAEGFRK